LELGGGQLLDRTAEVDPRVVHEDVEPAERPLDLGHHALARSFVGDIAGHADDAAPGRRRDLGGAFDDVGFGRAGDDDVGAGLGERGRHRHTEPS
jgi:hypothetical protein